jgi:DNA polymerase
MADRSSLPLAETIAAAQAWWREAGVDMVYHDEPKGWLAEPEPEPEAVTAPAAKPAPAPRPRIGGNPAGWPADLPAFRDWWLTEASLDHGGASARIAPRGEAGAEVMFVVPMPEAGDTKTLLAGPEGKLLASLATAMGVGPDDAYFAACLPRHTQAPDWERFAADGMGEVLLHHIALAAPKRLIVLGMRILPLLGHDPAQVAPCVSELAIQPAPVPMLAAYGPDKLLGNARQRAALWQSWLDWTGEG